MPLSPDALRAKAALELRRRREKPAHVAASGWRPWLREYFPRATAAGFAPRHVRLWEWLDELRPGVKPRRPVDVEIWPRGGGKSSTAELGVAYTGTQFRRRFALYVCATQGQANKHVQAIRGHFETLGIARAMTRYGNSLGWRMDLLRLAGGFNVLALGLDAAGRGVKLDDFRPDLLILDDIDDRHDSPRAVEKKVQTLTETILPMGAPELATLVVQNRIHPNSIVSRLADAKADFLHLREVHEEPAIEVPLDEHGKPVEDWYEAELLEDGRRRYSITQGRATWAGQSLETCEEQMNLWGRVAFLREAQHDLREVEGGLWNRKRDIDPFREPKPREQYDKIVVAIDPNTTGTGDEAGVVVAGSYWREAGVDENGKPRRIQHADVLEDATEAGGPTVWKHVAVDAYKRWRADSMVGEGNNGGEMVGITIGTVEGAPKVEIVHASRGKATRAQPVQTVAEEGRVHHVGVFPELERELCSWKVGEPSPNRLDALVWAITKLLNLTEEGPYRMPWFPGIGQRKGTKVKPLKL